MTTSNAYADRVFILDGGQALEEWMVWDTGLDEELINTPDGKVVAHDVRGVVSRRLTDQLGDLGVDPMAVGHIAFSRAHFDHVGKSRIRRAPDFIE